MSRREVISQLLGWFVNKFENREESVFDEETALQRPGLTFVGVDAALRQLRITYDAKRLHDIHAQFDDSPLPETSLTPGIRQKEFQFKEGERFCSLTLYISFAPEASTFLSKLKKTTEWTETQDKNVSALLQSDLGEASMKGGVVDWGRKNAQVCGVRFVTTLNRKFKVIAVMPAGFKTRYDLDVKSGICCGLLQEKDETKGVITGVGFLFAKEQPKPPPGTTAIRLGGIRTTFRRMVRGTVDSVKNFFWSLKVRSLQLIPLLLITAFTHFRHLVLHVILPLYDVVSDVVAGYYYYDEEVYIITALILLFVLLPHIILSLTLILEMILGIGEFDEYPKALVSFYKSKPTPINLLNNTLKLITLPLFTLLNFFWFFTSLIGLAIKLLGKLFCLAGAAIVSRVGQRHSETLRVDNVKDDAWSKTILLELFFETIPQLMTQVSALSALYESDDFVRGFPIVSSIVVSVINLMHQCFILRGFMQVTDLTMLNTIRYMLSGALDFFPLLNIYRNTSEHVLIQYCDNPVLLELWGPLQNVMKRNSSLKVVTLYLEDARDWMDMSLELLDSISSNDLMLLDVLDVCVEAENAEQARKVAVRMEELKVRFYDLLKKKRVRSIYFLIDSTVDIGILEAPAEQMTAVSKEVDGFKWSWEWPGGKTARIEYKIEQTQTQ